MAKTIIGLFNNKDEALRAIQELVSAGFPRGDFDMFVRNGAPAAADMAGKLMRAGVPEEDVREYSGRIAEGEAVVVVKAPDETAQRAVTVLERNGAKDVDEEGGRTNSGITASRPSSAPAPIAVAGTRVTEGGAPIPRDDNELALARDDVARARNIEERKTEERNPSRVKPEANPFRDSSSGDAGANPDREYADTCGVALASDPRHQGKDWDTIEPHARREWPTHNKGAWEEFKDMVRNAWEKMAGH